MNTSPGTLRLALCAATLAVAATACASDDPSDPGPQPFETHWAISGGGAEGDGCTGIAADGAGNAYVSGTFSGAASFGKQKLTATWPSCDVFAGKLKPDGEVAWVVNAGNDKSDSSGGIVVDTAGNSTITGTFERTGAFGTLTISAEGQDDAFIARLDPDGAFVWATPIGGPENDAGNALALDAQGNTYVTGEFHGTIKVGSASFTSRGGADIFVVKLDKGGKIVWGAAGGGPGNDDSSGITVDAKGNSYITGDFWGQAQLGAVSVKAVDDWVARAFVARLSPSGTFLWASAVGGEDSSHGRAVAVHDSGVFVTGSFKVGIFDGTKLTARGGSDIFVSSLDAGGKFVWTVPFGGGHASYGAAIASNGRGCVVSGMLDGSGVDFGGKHTLSGNRDLFVVALDADGKTLGAVSGGGTGYDQGSGVALGGGALFTCGRFTDTATFGAASLTSTGDGDAVFWKLQGPAW